jgi:hypothetical protein
MCACGTKLGRGASGSVIRCPACGIRYKKISAAKGIVKISRESR